MNTIKRSRTHDSSFSLFWARMMEFPSHKSSNESINQRQSCSDHPLLTSESVRPSIHLCFSCDRAAPTYSPRPESSKKSESIHKSINPFINPSTNPSILSSMLHLALLLLHHQFQQLLLLGWRTIRQLSLQLK
jgi:hypothetical protein